MFSPTLFVPVLSLLGLSALAMPAKDDGTPSFSLDKRVNEGDVLFEWPNAAWPNTEATVYYDTDWQKNGDVCAVSPAHPKAPFQPGWATVVNGGWTKCGGAILSEIDTDRIVAINQTLVWSDPKAFCGKEVKIFKADGEELLLDGKPFVLWDSCENCATKGAIIDVSARAMVELTPEKICSNNPKGVKYQILARNIWQPVENGIPGMNMNAGPLIWPPSKLPAPTPPFAQSDLGAVVTTTVVPVGPSPSAVVPGPSVAPGPSAAPGVLNLPAGSAGCSVYADLGKGKCEGRAYYVCNVLTNDIPPVMQWSVVSAHCLTYCDASLPAPCT